MDPTGFGGAIQPMEWLASARALILAAERSQVAPLAPRLEGRHSDTELVRVYCMLVGFAVENVVKGWFHECDVRHISTVADGELKKDMRNHRVRDLVQRTGFRLQSGDADLLEQLGEAAVWSGRYPSPTKATDLPALPAPKVEPVRELLARVLAHIGKPQNLFGTMFERGVCDLILILG